EVLIRLAACREPPPPADPVTAPAASAETGPVEHARARHTTLVGVGAVAIVGYALLLTVLFSGPRAAPRAAEISATADVALGPAPQPQPRPLVTSSGSVVTARTPVATSAPIATPARPAPRPSLPAPAARTVAPAPPAAKPAPVIAPRAVFSTLSTEE
ncbi:MAG TPA: hypothetical protein VLT33_28125, partial [Labilithrix sp.]|nr:hypothetical protein [Labilithrix sp.]